MTRYLNFTALLEPLMMITTTAANTAMKAALPLAPIDVMAKNISKEMSGGCEKTGVMMRIIVRRFNDTIPRQCATDAVRMLASTKRMVPGTVLAAMTRHRMATMKEKIII